MDSFLYLEGKVRLLYMVLSYNSSFDNWEMTEFQLNTKKLNFTDTIWIHNIVGLTEIYIKDK